MKISVKRVYEPYSVDDGYRVLVDRLWPRGIKKTDLNYNLWAKDLAPSNELRKWFAHDPEKWEGFKTKYFKELENNSAILKNILLDCSNNNLTLLYSSRNKDMNQAHVIKEYLEYRLLTKN